MLRLTITLVTFGILAGMLVAPPRVAKACSWSPIVARTRTEGNVPSCLEAYETAEAIPGSEMEDEYDPYRTNLVVWSSCEDTVEVRVSHCVDCEGPFLLVPRPDGNDASAVIDVGVHIDETVGEDIPVLVEWSTSGASGEFSVVFEMADTHPDDQNGCEGCWCGVSNDDAPPLLEGLIVIFGVAFVRRSGRRSRSAKSA